MAVAIGNLGTIPTLTVGGVVFTDLTTLIVLAANVPTSTRFTTFRKPGSTSGYQTTSGKTLTIRATKTITTNTGSTFNTILLYGDTDVGLNSAAAPTTAVYNCGDTSLTSGAIAVPAAGTFLGTEEVAQFFPVPAAKYSALTNNATGTGAWAYGYEA